LIRKVLKYQNGTRKPSGNVWLITKNPEQAVDFDATMKDIGKDL
jgi:hypothetical protein